MWNSYLNVAMPTCLMTFTSVLLLKESVIHAVRLLPLLHRPPHSWQVGTSFLHPDFEPHSRFPICLSARHVPVKIGGALQVIKSFICPRIFLLSTLSFICLSIQISAIPLVTLIEFCQTPQLSGKIIWFRSQRSRLHTGVNVQIWWVTQRQVLYYTISFHSLKLRTFKILPAQHMFAMSGH